MAVKLLGKSRSLILVQPRNAYVPIVVKESSKPIVVSDVHPSKAFAPMEVTESEMRMLARVVLPLKAFAAMVCTV